MTEPIWPRPDLFDCPGCDARLTAADNYTEGLDEKSDGRTHPYACWRCPSCGQEVHDWDDEFAFVDDEPEPQNPIRTARIDRGLSLSDVAAAAGMSRAQLASVEEGRQKLARNQAIDIAQHLGIDIKDLAPYLSP